MPDLQFLIFYLDIRSFLSRLNFNLVVEMSKLQLPVLSHTMYYMRGSALVLARGERLIMCERGTLKHHNDILGLELRGTNILGLPFYMFLKLVLNNMKKLSFDVNKDFCP